MLLPAQANEHGDQGEVAEMFTGQDHMQCYGQKNASGPGLFPDLKCILAEKTKDEPNRI